MKTQLISYIYHNNPASVECFNSDMQKFQPLKSANVELKVKYGASIESVTEEANSIFNTLNCYDVEIIVWFEFNGEKFFSDGKECKVMEVSK